MTTNQNNERAQQAAAEIAVDGISLRINRDEQVKRWADIIAKHFPAEAQPPSIEIVPISEKGVKKL